jgi:hypothetical protein
MVSLNTTVSTRLFLRVHVLARDLLLEALHLLQLPLLITLILWPLQRAAWLNT